MKPLEVDKLPIQYTIDKELISLISEANLKYGEYKSNLKNSQFDSRFFLDSIILSESLKSTQIEGTQISQDDMYYLKYSLILLHYVLRNLYQNLHYVQLVHYLL